jgi:hypothetical protein
VLQTIEIPCQTPVKNGATLSPSSDTLPPDPKLLQAVVRAHAWLRDLKSGNCASIEDLAETVKLHPKVVRQNLRLAFLAPSITTNVPEQRSFSLLSEIPIQLALSWTDQIAFVDS